MHRNGTRYATLRHATPRASAFGREKDRDKAREKARSVGGIYCRVMRWNMRTVAPQDM